MLVLNLPQTFSNLIVINLYFFVKHSFLTFHHEKQGSLDCACFPLSAGLVTLPVYHFSLMCHLFIFITVTVLYSILHIAALKYSTF